jgi:hypothetical protein
VAGLTQAGYPRAPTTARCARPAAWRARLEGRAPSAGCRLWTTGITLSTQLTAECVHSVRRRIGMKDALLHQQATYGNGIRPVDLQ